MKRMTLLNAVLGMGTLVFLVASIWAYLQPLPPEPPWPKATKPSIQIVWHRGTKPKVSLDKPFKLEFSEGEGSIPANTVQMDESGLVHLQTERYDLTTPPEDYKKWMTADLQLSPEAVQRILIGLQQHRVLELEREYHHANINIGPQRVFWMEQAGWEKGTWCNDYFPKEIQGFTEDLERELEKAGLQKALWKETDKNDALIKKIIEINLGIK